MGFYERKELLYFLIFLWNKYKHTLKINKKEYHPNLANIFKKISEICLDKLDYL